MIQIISKHEKSYKNVLIYHIGYLTVKDLRYIKINSIDPLHLIINKINGYIEERNGNKYLTIVLNAESKDKLKKYEELWIKIRDLIRSITNNPDDSDEKYMNIKFNPDDNLPLKKR